MIHVARRLLALMILCFLPALAQAQTARPFDTARLSYLDARFLQAALAFNGDYVGRIDGAWGRFSDRALRAATGNRPAERDVVPLLLPLIEDIDRVGWAAFNHDQGTSALLPSGIMQTTTGADFVELFTPSRDLVVRYIYRTGPSSGAMHDWLRDAHAGPEDFYRADTDQAFVSKGRIASGALVYLRTISIPDSFETVLVQADRRQEARARVVIASLSNRQQPDLILPPDGYFAAIVNRPLPRAPVVPPQAPAQPEARASERGHGTAFHIGNADLLTAWHVVEDCRRVTLEDGTAVQVIAHDPVLDTALLTSPRRSNDWVALDAASLPRLGQDVFALGFPYSRTEADGLVATSGSLSGLASDSDRPRHMISAPVQPGNSGGPVVARNGQVVGLVTARLDDTATYGATGTVPQNVNFATPVAPILGFLKRAGVVLTPPPAGETLVGDGIPAAVQRSVRRVLCW